MTYSGDVYKEEEPILEDFRNIRQELLHLKQDRRQYLNSKNIYKIYELVLTKVNELRAIRKGISEADPTTTVTNNETINFAHSSIADTPMQPLNRVDSVLDDIFQLLSLSFLTCGLKNTAPATYSSLSTVQRLLEHLEESKIYTFHDLRPIKARLEEISKIVENSSFVHFTGNTNKNETNTSNTNTSTPQTTANEESNASNTPNATNSNTTNSDSTNSDTPGSEHKTSSGTEMFPDLHFAPTTLKQNDILEDSILKKKLRNCLIEYERIENNIEKIDPKLEPVMEELYGLRRELLSLTVASRTGSLQKVTGDSTPTSTTTTTTNSTTTSTSTSAAISRSNSNTSMINYGTPSYLNKYNDKLLSIEDRLARKLGTAPGMALSMSTNNLSGQTVLNGLIDDCHDLLNDLTHNHYYTKTDENYYNDPELNRIYNTLVQTKTNLENLLITRRWTLRETDLFQYQKKLEDIDRLRTNGKFFAGSSSSSSSSATSSVEEQKSQSILLYLLRRCYAIIYKLLESSEPVSESLQRVHNQLSTVRRCLLELKRMGGVDNERELYPYQMKLASLDNMKVDGKFYDDDGNVPEGQGTLCCLLNECFDILHELEIEAEDKEKLNSRESTPFGKKCSKQQHHHHNNNNASTPLKNSTLLHKSASLGNKSTGKGKHTDSSSSMQLTKDDSTRDVSELGKSNDEEEIAELTKNMQYKKFLNSQGHEDDGDSTYSLDESLVEGEEDDDEEERGGGRGINEEGAVLLLSLEKEDFEELDVVCKIFDDSADDVLKVDVAELRSTSEDCRDEEFDIEEWEDDTEMTVVCNVGVENVDEGLEDSRSVKPVEIEELKAELLAMFGDKASELAEVLSKLELNEDDDDVWEIAIIELENKLVKVVDKGSAEGLDFDDKMLAEVEISVAENDTEEIIETEADDIDDTLERLEPVISEVEGRLEELGVKKPLELNVDCLKE
ncbi:hypothetical protein ACO0QE_001502 [Hanseniaspora vineae]